MRKGGSKTEVQAFDFNWHPKSVPVGTPLAMSSRTLSLDVFSSLLNESSCDRRDSGLSPQWTNGSAFGRHLFPDGTDFDGEEFGTVSTPLLFSLIEHDPKDSWVRPANLALYC